MTFEAACKRLSTENIKTLETIEDSLQMLSPADIGRKAYNDTMKDYNEFFKTLNMDCLKRLAHTINSVTGMEVR